MKIYFRKCLSLLLVVTVILGSSFAGVTEFDFDNVFVNSLGNLFIKAGAAEESFLTFTKADDGLSYIVSACDKTASGHITVPSTYDGLPVTEIGYKAFFACHDITSIEICDGIKIIDGNAFASCTNMVFIEIPDSVEKIGPFAFRSCLSLTEFIFPDKVTYISNNVFSSCESLESVTYSDNVTYIGDGAFDYCHSLKSITIPAGADIGIDIAYECTSLEEITVDEKNKKYASVDGVLFNKNKMYLYKYPAGKKVDEYTIPDGVKELAVYSFDHSKIKTVHFPESLQKITNNAFYCSEITSIVIPETVETIEYDAFRSCSNLRAVLICGSQTELQYDPFDSVTSFYYFCPEYSNAFFFGSEYCSPYITYKPGTIIDIDNKILRVDGSESKIDKILYCAYEPMSFSMNTATVCTGSVVSLYRFSVFTSAYTVVVDGDTTGDGVCDILDCTYVERALSKSSNLNGFYAMAGDSNSDNIIDTTDYQAIVNKALMA